MLSLKLAFRNLIGAGLRTWLNVSVLSVAFVVMVFYNGMLDGWNRQAHDDTINWEVGGGQLWHPLYDPFDLLGLQEAHGVIENQAKKLIGQKQITPVLVTQGSIFPHGRMQNILLKGVQPEQEIIGLPTSNLVSHAGQEIPAMIGKRMALFTNLKKGDNVLVRWRDKNGTFDAREFNIVEIFNSNVPTVDNGQIYLPLNTLQEMTGMIDEATLFVAATNYTGGNFDEWQFKSPKYLLKEIDEIIKSKKAGSAVNYILLLSIALLAIFDTQVLSIFRRQREIGTYIAMGMTRSQVVRIFTVEGAAHSLLALGLAAIYGTPLLYLLQKNGIPISQTFDSLGVSIASKIIPVYAFAMIVLSILLVVVSATIVSYFPARKIARMKPTDALKGKIQ